MEVNPKLLAYLEEEVGKNPSKKKSFDTILKSIRDAGLEGTIIRVRGDGNCLIRALLVDLVAKAKSITGNLLAELCLQNGAEIIVDFDAEKICVLVRDLVSRLWAYKGGPEYHMNENAIDGLAVNMVMRLLGVTKLRIYQAFDGTDRKAGWRDIELDPKMEPLFTQDTKGVTAHIFTLDGRHYNGIL